MIRCNYSMSEGLKYETKYSRMDQENFVEDNLQKNYLIHS